MTQIAEVLRTNRKTHDLFNHGREVGQRANDAEGWSIGGACQTPRGGQSKRVLHRREQTVRTTNGAAGARSGAVNFEKPADVVTLFHEFKLADRAATGR